MRLIGELDINRLLIPMLFNFSDNKKMICSVKCLYKISVYNISLISFINAAQNIVVKKIYYQISAVYFKNKLTIPSHRLNNKFAENKFFKFNKTATELHY